MATNPITIFYSYSHNDEALKEQLDTRLALLRRRGLVSTWHDRRILPGQDWNKVIDTHLDEADIVIFLVSADFIASDYCYGKGIPVIVRAVDWGDTMFGKLQALPKDARPVTSWNNQDEAWMDVEKGVKKAIDELQEIKYREATTSTLTSMRDVIVGELKQLENLYTNLTEDIVCEGIPTGIRDLDITLGGLRPSEFVVVAGRPSMGKSDLLVNIAANSGVQNSQAVGFFSLQMPAQRVIKRLIASTSDVDARKMWRGYLGEKDFPKIAKAVGRLFEAPLYIDETPRLSMAEIISRAKSLKIEKKIRLLLIDSLQQIVIPSTSTIDSSIIALKSLAKDLQIPVVVTSNVARKVDQRLDKRPNLSDLGDWGNLEQEADVVLFLFRDEIYDMQEYNRGVLEIIVAKNRNGPTDTVTASYRPEISKICNYLESVADSYEVEQD